jgi:hypothetical protein
MAEYERYEKCIKNLEGIDRLKILGLDVVKILKWMLKIHGVRVWTMSVWFRIGTSVGLLWTRWLTFRFHKRSRIYWLTERLLAFEEGLCSMKFVSTSLTRC